MGYTDVKVFHDGFPAWKKSGNLVVSAPNYLKDMIEKDIPTVLIDLRPVDESKRGHITGAVSISSERIAFSKDKFPGDKSAPIILYAGDAQSAADAFKIIRGWGFSNISVLEGGIDSWKRSGNLLVSGELKSTVVYIPKLRPGEISIEEFKRIAETLPADKLILDVRDKDEAMQGMLKGAINIPQQEISKRLGEIPKDKEIITHCITGVRSEMSYHILKDLGYKIRFLNATINIDKEGKYMITKE